MHSHVNVRDIEIYNGGNPKLLDDDYISIPLSHFICLYYSELCELLNINPKSNSSNIITKAQEKYDVSIVADFIQNYLQTTSDFNVYIALVKDFDLVKDSNASGEEIPCKLYITEHIFPHVNTEKIFISKQISRKISSKYKNGMIIMLKKELEEE